MRTFLSHTLLLFAVLSLAGCKKDDSPAQQTIADIVNSDSRFTLLRAAVAKANLGSALSTGSLTVFAPTDDAFRAAGLDAAAVNAAPVATVTSILQNHVLGAKTLSGDLPTADNTEVTTLGGGKIYVTKKAGAVSVNGARVTQADVTASNGVIHVVDRVILPPAGNAVQVASANPNLSLLVAAVNRAASGNPAVLTALTGPGPLTVFAPTNAAFNAAGFADVAAINAAAPATLANILLYHVVPARVFSTNLVNGDVTTAQTGKVTVAVSGSGVTVKGAKNTTAANVTAADIVATNAVIHVVNQVLLP
jgi:uncharacterized surface protein with fasciclin (FAS1) repeats